MRWKSSRAALGRAAAAKDPRRAARAAPRDPAAPRPGPAGGAIGPAGPPACPACPAAGRPFSPFFVSFASPGGGVLLRRPGAAWPAMAAPTRLPAMGRRPSTTFGGREKQYGTEAGLAARHMARTGQCAATAVINAFFEFRSKSNASRTSAANAT